MTNIIDILYTEPTAGDTLIRAHIVGDTAAELPAITQYSGYELLMGSRFDDLSTGDTYKMQSDGTWVRQPLAQSDTYTTTQIDNLVDGRIPFDLPQAAAAGDDLDDYTTQGTWALPAAGIANNPASGAARLDVLRVSDTIVRQYVRPVGTNMRTYVRNSLGTTPETWADWLIDVTNNGVRAQIYLVGQDLTANDDLNALTSADDCHTWQTTTRAIAQTIAHRPDYADASTKIFRVEQYAANANNRFIQRMTVVTASGSGQGAIEQYIRTYTAGGWGSWYQVPLTAVPDYVPTP